MRPFLSVLLETLPLIALFAGTHLYSLFIGAGAAVFVSAILIIIQFAKDRTLLYFPLFSTLLSVVFIITAFITGETVFIKIQASLFNICFAFILLTGWTRGYPIMKLFFGKQFMLTQETWMKLSFRWGMFFCVLAIANEIAWRSLDDNGWVNAKLFVFAPATAVFMALQIPLTLRGRISHTKIK
ncbi:MAG: intracellular septation protein A [Alphaproteobacteria bacterium]|jgi:intracellular septation protein|nr:intracellular septation protein A [Alphaproteobacteria bacterium]MBT5798207.1 intracellular septation protein A [Alphaproteobacteria bacterium]